MSQAHQTLLMPMPQPAPAPRREKKKVGRVREKEGEKERVRQGPAPRTRQERPPHHLFQGGGWREKETERGGVGVGWVDARLTLAREQVFWFQTKALDVRERDELGLSGGKVVPLDLHPLVRYLNVLVLVQQAHRALLFSGLPDLSLGSPPPPSWYFPNFSEKSFFTRQLVRRVEIPFWWPRGPGKLLSDRAQKKRRRAHGDGRRWCTRPASTRSTGLGRERERESE